MKTIRQEELRQALKGCGIEAGDTVLVHSDLRPFGLPEGAATKEEILNFYLEAFKAILGPEGTLAVPAYFYEYARLGVPFDVDLSPVSLSLGSFSQYLNTQPGRVRSCNPLQSIAALGKKAEELAGGLSLSGYGAASPWHRLRLMGGKLLFLGTTLQSMTYVHYIEQQYGVPHLYFKLYDYPVIKQGKSLPGKPISAVRYLDFDIHYHIQPFQERLKNKGLLREVPFHGIPLFLVDAEEAYQEGLQALDHDPFFFLKSPPSFVPGRIPFDGMTGPLQKREALAPQIIRKLWHLNRNFCSTDYEKSLEELQQHLPFKVYTYPASKPLNGWEIPPKWDLVEASISKEGQKLFTVTHPLQIIGLSSSFEGTVSLQELKDHLYYDHRDPRATPYHFRQNYRPWSRDWGFCVARQFYDSLEEGDYHVKIVTQESEGYLKVAEYTKEGDTPYTFAFVAHLDHPGMMNDDLAGVAVGVELMQRLSQKRTKFSYRLVLVQEVIGSVYYLADHSQMILESCFLEMLGTNTAFALQASQKGTSRIEKELEQELKATQAIFRTGPFRSIICNDEIVWESIGIPMSSFSRFPYPEYHSDRDNLSIMSPQALEEAVNILERILEKIDRSTLMVKQFSGVLSVANPQYGLYVEPGQPAFGTVADAETQKLRLLMDLLPLLPQYTFVDQLAAQLHLDPAVALNYLKCWQSKGLIEII